MNWLALLAAFICAIVAIAYALPMLLVAFVARFLRRRTGVPIPLAVMAVLRLRWTPVLLWAGAAILFAYVAFNG